jgi:hypothetical protein
LPTAWWLLAGCKRIGRMAQSRGIALDRKRT